MSERRSLEFRKYQIWADCERHGWDRSAEEIGEGIGMTQGHVRVILSSAGWIGRIGSPGDKSAAGTRNGALTAKSMGRKFDENVLDVTDLMRGTR